MKKFLATLLIVGNLFFMSAAHAEIETYTGADRATMSEAETFDSDALQKEIRSWEQGVFS